MNHIFTFSEKFTKNPTIKKCLKIVLPHFLPLSHVVLSACTHSVQFYGNVSPHVLFRNPGMCSYTHTDLLLIPKKKNDETRFKLRQMWPSNFILHVKCK